MNPAVSKKAPSNAKKPNKKKPLTYAEAYHLAYMALAGRESKENQAEISKAVASELMPSKMVLDFCRRVATMGETMFEGPEAKSA